MKNIKNYFFKTCPRSGRIVGLRKDSRWLRWLLPLTGILALIWFLIRVLPKPSRIAYPCQQVAAPLAFSFLAFLASLFSGLFSFKRFFAIRKKQRFAGSILFLTAGITLTLFFYILSVDNRLMSQVVRQQLDQGTDMGSFVPEDAPNRPIGMGRGIYPGRVAWAYDPQAARWDGENGLFTDACFNSQTRVDDMLAGVILSLTHQSSLPDAWNELFIIHNNKKGKGNTGYSTGEKIAVKINLNSNGGNDRADATPQSVCALLSQLIYVVGVPEDCITVYDAQRRGISTVYNYNYPLFPNVHYQQWGGFVPDMIRYSSEITDEKAMSLARVACEADYMINMALMKRHSEPTGSWRDGAGQTGITSTGKNQFGSVGSVPPLHLSIRDWSSFRGMGTYNSIVDLMSHPLLGENTLVFLIDALYASPKHNGKAIPFQRPPFNGGWPSSFFASLDEVAIQSVALDFIHSELPLPAHADNFLHEAALIGTPPSGIHYVYAKETKSLGVHEHWNNPEERLYSRNLGKEEGIELYRVPLDDNRPAIDYFYMDKRFTRPGQSVTVYWKTTGADSVCLSGQPVAREGSMVFTPEISGRMELKLYKQGKERVSQALALQHMEIKGEYAVTEAIPEGSARIDEKSFAEFAAEQGNATGALNWEVKVPVEGAYYIVISYKGMEPAPSWLYINEQLITENFGYQGTRGDETGYFLYPVTLQKGTNQVKIEHMGRRSNKLYHLLIAKIRS